MTARPVGIPQPGWYTMRRAKGAVLVPVLVYRPCPLDPHTGEWLDRWHPLIALIDGVDDVLAYTICDWLKSITRAEYEYLVADHAWCRRHAPDAPQANTGKAIDLNAMKPFF